VPSSDVRPIPFGYTPRQTNLVDWFPYIPPYRPGEGWLIRSAGYFGEHLAYESADFEVSFKLADTRASLVVAASAPAQGEQSEGGEYRYSYNNARNFALSVSHEYVVYTGTVGTTTVLSYAFPYHASAGQGTLQTTVEALEVYNRLFGPYPRPLLSVVEADFLDGMEYDGLYFLSNGFYNLYQGTPGEYLVTIAAHETAHQWFYARVGNDQAMEPWLDEALCTYSERLFYENVHPDALPWWWDYRVNYYHPQGWVDGSIYNPAGYRAYRDAVYLNGAVFLEELRKQVGDEAFFAILRDYVAQMSGKIATRQDFFRILGEHSQADIAPLLKTYFQGN
jgi:aminopeptidase N